MHKGGVESMGSPPHLNFRSTNLEPKRRSEMIPKRHLTLAPPSGRNLGRGALPRVNSEFTLGYDPLALRAEDVSEINWLALRSRRENTGKGSLLEQRLEKARGSAAARRNVQNAGCETRWLLQMQFARFCKRVFLSFDGPKNFFARAKTFLGYTGLKIAKR